MLEKLDNGVLFKAIEKFGNLLQNAAGFIVEACKLYVENIDKYECGKDAFIEKYPYISQTTWKRYESIGRGSIHPLIATSYSIAQPYLEKLSFSDQELYLSKRIDVLSSDGSTLKVKFNEIQSEQIKVVFAKDHIRTLSEQKSFIDSERAKINERIAVKTKSVERAYFCSAGFLVVNKPIKFTKIDLLKILEDL